MEKIRRHEHIGKLYYYSAYCLYITCRRLLHSLGRLYYFIALSALPSDWLSFPDLVHSDRGSGWWVVWVCIYGWQENTGKVKWKKSPQSSIYDKLWFRAKTQGRVKNVAVISKKSRVTFEPWNVSFSRVERRVCVFVCAWSCWRGTRVCGDKQLVDGLNAQFSRGAHISNLGKI